MIIINNEDALRVKCEDVKPDEIGHLIDLLESELNYANKLGKGGIGLAAPQIGIAKNIAIVRLGKTKDLSIDLINPKIINAYDSAIFRQEGCLSFPGKIEDTLRFQEIYVSNNLGYPNNFTATGLLAVVCQHEIDHLNAILFMDHKITIQKISNKSRIKPNDLCFCGKIDPVTKNKKKYKKCCGKYE